MDFTFSDFARTSFNLGNVLLSHTVTHAVPSALKGLTSVFGMGTGVSPSPWLPRNLNSNFGFRNSNFEILKNMDEGTLENKFNYGQADRPISISMLSALRHLHI